MRVSRFLLFIFLILASSPHLNSQQSTTTPQRDQQAISILTQTQTAMAPSSVTIQDALLQGSYTDTNGNAGSITIKCKGPYMLRNEMNLNGVQYTIVANNGKGYAAQNAKTRKLPLWMTQYLRPEHVPAFWRPADYIQPNVNVSYVGLEQVAGMPTHHIRLTSLPVDGTPAAVEAIISEFHVFVDSKTGLVVKTWSYDFSPAIIENRSLVESFYTDYRQVGSQLIPFHSVRLVGGQKFSEITFSSVQFNVGLADSEFQLQ